jgi:hypothetical protein
MSIVTQLQAGGVERALRRKFESASVHTFHPLAVQTGENARLLFMERALSAFLLGRQKPMQLFSVLDIKKRYEAISAAIPNLWRFK